ncbi:hypothetical protein Droror1_Dr00023379 [Drosera rotundifolia]
MRAAQPARTARNEQLVAEQGAVPRCLKLLVSCLLLDLALDHYVVESGGLAFETVRGCCSWCWLGVVLVEFGFVGFGRETMVLSLCSGFLVVALDCWGFDVARGIAELGTTGLGEVKLVGNWVSLMVVPHGLLANYYGLRLEMNLAVL